MLSALLKAIFYLAAFLKYFVSETLQRQLLNDPGPIL